MTGKYAWLGSLELKEEVLADLAEDRAQERYIQREFLIGSNDRDQAFHGCHIGCLMMARVRYDNRRDRAPDELSVLVRSYENDAAHWHGEVPGKLGMPRHMAEFWDKFFEKLSPALAPRFAVESLECVPVGVDLSNVLAELIAWILPTFLHGADIRRPYEKQVSAYLTTVANAWQARAADFGRNGALGVDDVEVDQDHIRQLVRGFPTDPRHRFHWAALALASASSAAVTVHVANAVIDEWAEAILEGAFALPSPEGHPFDFADETIEDRDRILWSVATKFFELCAAAPQGVEPS